MPYLVRSFYKYSTQKLWLKILPQQGKKSRFQHFHTRWLKSYIAVKQQFTFNLGLNAAKNTRIPSKKKIGINVVRNLIMYKIVGERICLSPPRVELGDTKDWCSWNIIFFKNSKIYSIWGSTMLKILIPSKKVRIKVVRNWISYKKVLEHKCLSPHNGGRGHKKLFNFNPISFQKFRISGKIMTDWNIRWSRTARIFKFYNITNWTFQEISKIRHCDKILKFVTIINL